MVRKSLSREIQKILFGSSVVFSVGLAPTVLAQESEEPTVNEDEVEIINVVGIRSSLIENLALKRDSAAFVDAITAEDIGKFPDINVADSLQRVPGVSITRSGGEGQSVSIRGTSSDLTLTQLNGNYIATGSASREPSRSFNYTLLPSNLISRVEVYKSPEAKIDEGGLGGTVILRTRRPLEEEANSGFVNLDSTYADVTEEVEPQFSGLYSWKNEKETFGILASYVSQDRTAITEQITLENWQNWDTSQFDLDPRPDNTQPSIEGNDGSLISGVAPFAVVQRKQDEERNREAFQLTAQYQPTDSLTFTANYFRTELEQNNDNNLLLLAEWDYRKGLVDPASVNINQNGNITALTIVDNDPNDSIELQAPAIGSRRSIATSTSDTFDFEVEYEGDDYEVSANIGRTKAEGGKSFDNLMRFNSLGGNNTTYGWDLNAPTTITSDAVASDFGTAGWNSTDGGVTTDEETYAQLDATFFVELGPITSIDVGVKTRDHEINRTLSQVFWDDGDPNNGTIWGGCCGDQWWFTDTNAEAVGAAAATGQFYSYAETTGEAGTQTRFLTLDWDAFGAYMDSNFIRENRSDPGFFFNVKEKINAAYAQFNFEYEKLSGNFGVRVIETEQTAETFDSVNGERSSDLNSREGSYTDVLPSLNLKYDLTDDLVARFSASKTVARVNYGDIGTSESYSRPIVPDGDDGVSQLETSGSAGNPNLKPFESTQYDLGLEWYFDEGSYLGGAIYRKDIGSFVANGSFREVRTNVPNFEGRPVVINFTGPINLDDAVSQGFELAYQQTFAFGGGVIFNYTYADTEKGEVTDLDGTTRDAPLPGTSENQYNVSVFYENETLSARVSYNYRDKYPVGNRQNGRELFAKARSQVDVNASYYITEAMSVNASIINLTKERDIAYLDSEDIVNSRSYSGRRFNVGVNYKF